MKRAKLEKLLLKSRLAKALHKAGYPHISIQGNKEKIQLCTASISIRDIDISQSYDFSGVEDVMEAANAILINIEPDIRKAAPDLEYEWFSDGV